MHAYRTYLYTLCAVLVILGASFALAQDNALKFKLKPDATGKLCFNCHAAFKEKMSKPFVHTPLKKGECTGCHNPHTSTHGKLLSADNGGVCYRCHSSVVPSGARSVHKVVGEGNCMKCHDPHSAPNKENLLKGGNELCFECHKEMGATLSKVKYRHMPVAQGCLNCHDPHSSAKNPYLLKNDIIPLCVGCHKTDRPMFAKKHMNYPVANARCTGCHDPHGSDNPGILYNTVHKPVATRMCNQCHEEATSPNPLATKKTGTDLCRGCHNDMVNTTFGLNRVHGPLLSKQGCLSCHNPHAGKQKGILRQPMAVLCNSCHVDNMKRQEKVASPHEPVKNGQCTACHDPHSSNYLFLTRKSLDIELCADCHDWAHHSTHPIGEKFRDPRNKNIPILCVSCHDAHGTEFKKMLYYPKTSDLCVQCHEQYKR